MGNPRPYQMSLFADPKARSRAGHAQKNMAEMLELTDQIRRYPVKLRDCLRCGSPFRSTGPHHRKCDQCRLDTPGTSAAEVAV